MGAKVGSSKTDQNSVTLSKETIELLDQVAKCGLGFSTRAEAARVMIARGLEEYIGKGIIKPYVSGE